MANIFKSIERGIMKPVSVVLPPCRDIAQLISSGLDRKLPLRQRVAVRIHLALCKFCRRYNTQLLLLQEATVRYANPERNTAEETLSQDAKERIKRALKG